MPRCTFWTYIGADPFLTVYVLDVYTSKVQKQDIHRGGVVLDGVRPLHTYLESTETVLGNWAYIGEDPFLTVYVLNVHRLSDCCYCGCLCCYCCCLCCCCCRRNTSSTYIPRKYRNSPWFLIKCVRLERTPYIDPRWPTWFRKNDFGLSLYNIHRIWVALLRLEIKLKICCKVNSLYGYI